ncbi:MAG: 50S ribosomal protein L23 [Verrucomicrobia bacterium]|nr:50S ribosomal protein L23 [Verrucomicrobiota bacterium]MCH8514493.1 50S ribosomal protein L23 [Kiritimatiellia bacterium]
MKPAHQVIDTILLTEKGTVLTEQHNQYIFKVYPSANKNDIKTAVESLFKVHVTDVRTMNRIGKKKRERRPNYGRTSAWKKAVVTLKEGDTIDLT